MKTEFEVRILEISFDAMIAKLEAAGAKRIGAFHQKRYTYNFTPPVDGKFVRLRSNGEKTTLTIKEITEESIDGTRELEIVVSNFEDTNLILEKLGYKVHSYEENFRIEYKLNNVEIALDKWPKIPPFMEIEGNSKDDVLKNLSVLGFGIDDYTAIKVKTIYKEKYKIDLDDISNRYLKLSDEEKASIMNK